MNIIEKTNLLFSIFIQPKHDKEIKWYFMVNFLALPNMGNDIIGNYFPSNPFHKPNRA